jgi:hypothetical protein
MIADADWNCSINNNDIYDIETIYDTTDDIIYPCFDQFWDYQYRTFVMYNT